MIITFANHKGGVGKTTLASIIAENLIQAGVPVEMIDLDPQHNFTKRMETWAQVAETEINIKQAMPEQFAEDKFIVIDTPPAMGEDTEKAIALADRVVVPTDCCMDGVSGMQYLLNKNKNITVIVNRFMNHRPRDRKVFELLQQQLGANNIPVESVPEIGFIRSNLDEGNLWSRNLSANRQKEIINFVQKVMKGEN